MKVSLGDVLLRVHGSKRGAQITILSEAIRQCFLGVKGCCFLGGRGGGVCVCKGKKGLCSRLTSQRDKHNLQQLRLSLAIPTLNAHPHDSLRLRVWLVRQSNGME